MRATLPLLAIGWGCGGLEAEDGLPADEAGDVAPEASGAQACTGPGCPLRFGTSVSAMATCNGVGSLFALALDSETIDLGVPGVVSTAAARGTTPELLINKDNPTETGNPVLRWSSLHSGSVARLPTGQLADEGVFRMGGPNLTGGGGPFTLAAYVAGTVTQDRLDEVQNVSPIFGSSLERLVGQRFVAVAYDSDISMNYFPTRANLQGARLGRLFFTVLGLGSGTLFPDLVVRVDPPSNDTPLESSTLVGGSLTCTETARSCTQGYGDVHTGPLPAGCVRLTGATLGTAGPIAVGANTVHFDAWTARTAGNFVAFSYRSTPGDVYVSARAGSVTAVDDGDGVWTHPNGLSGGGVSGVSQVVLCPCTVGAPMPPAPPSTCGNGALDPGEVCDDGNTAASDGCNATCTQVDAGWTCPTAGQACQAAQCGDGIVAGWEECEDDDATPTSGDGCSSTCRLEAGFHCPTAGAACVSSSCGNGVREGVEDCDDGDSDLGDGCTPACKLEPSCSNGTCAAICGDALIVVGEACDDGNRRSGDGCSATCQIEPGFACQQVALSASSTLELPVVYRDFIRGDRPGGHPDFQVPTHNGMVQGMVSTTLDTDGLPVLVNGTSSGGATVINSPTTFRDWYRDSSFSLTVPGTLRLTRLTGRTFQLDSNQFFPLNGPCPSSDPYVLCGLTGLGVETPFNMKNYHFTTVVRRFFKFAGGEVLRFRGDDDVWAFINRRLAVDIGGIHGPVERSITLNATNASNLGLTSGGIYELAVFHAERKFSDSNFRLTFVDFDNEITACTPVCGNAIVTPSELCDDGLNTGASPNACMPGCAARARCGDAIHQPWEACDDGVNSGTYGGCMPGCAALGPRCGDGVQQGAEVCDDGTNAGAYGGCMPGCASLGPRCGDGVVQGAETCDDGNGASGDGCSSSCQSESSSGCVFADFAMCAAGPCAADPASAACAEAMETYCGLHPSELPCRFRACNSGVFSMTACEQAVQAYCAANPADPDC